MKWIISVGIAVTATTILAVVWRDRSRRIDGSSWSDLGFQLSILFIVGYIGWWLDIALNHWKASLIWTAGIAFAGPIFGVILSFAALLASLVAPAKERTRLFTANILFLSSSLLLLVAPN